MAGPTSLSQTLRTLLAIPDRLPPVAASSLLIPDGQGPFPAVLYAHAHGGDYALGRRELTEGAPWLSKPYAPDLLAAGFAVLCVDMPGFGDRLDEGGESALAKAGLWQGRPLFGQMVAQQLSAFNSLAEDPRIDPARIATLGISMGGALAMWTAALEPRVCAIAQLCILADIAPLIDLGVHDRHGIYLSVPGLLRHAEIGDIAASIAPRPQFIGHGATDPLTPATARDAAVSRVRAAYDASNYPDHLTTYMASDSGHTETPEMRAAVLTFLSGTAAKPQTRKRETCLTNF